jgi:predicted N-acetyltransferase YhbS
MDKQTLSKMIDETCAMVGKDIQAEGAIWPLSIPGVKARVSTIQDPVLNLVGMATFSETNVDEGIQNVIEQYRQEQKIFGWVVGPTSQPANLGERLLAAGLVKVEEEAQWGMVLHDLDHAIAVNADIRVEQVTFADWDAHVAMIAQAFGFGMTEDASRLVVRLYESLGEKAKVYLAYVPDREEPVAFSAFVYDEESHAVTLGPAATLEAYRSKGIYTSMVAKRLDDAREMGATCAVIQAVKKTSAPLCQRMGFEVVSSIDLYAYL